MLTLLKRQMETVIKSFGDRTRSCTYAILSHMFKDSKEAHSTVSDMASSSALIPFVRGRVSKPSGLIPDYSSRHLVEFYAGQYPNKPPVTTNRIINDADTPLSQYACFYDHVLLNGRRVTPLDRSLRNNAGSSLIKVKWDRQYHSGELLSIFDHQQFHDEPASLFAEVRWMVPLHDIPFEEDYWEELCVFIFSLVLYLSFCPVRSSQLSSSKGPSMQVAATIPRLQLFLSTPSFASSLVELLTASNRLSGSQRQWHGFVFSHSVSIVHDHSNHRHFYKVPLPGDETETV